MKKITQKALNELARRVSHEWRDDPNVLHVSVGYKRRGDSFLPGPALCFGVREKYRRVKEIRAAGSRPIPKEIEGVPTDISSLKGTASGLITGPRGFDIQNPLVGGCSTAPLTYSSFISFPVHAGTLGGICYQGGELMAISNGHVWGDSLGCEIVQPAFPIKQIASAFLETLACGAIPAYIATDSSPSLLTGGLAAAAGAMWIWAAAADYKDPHRRGQEATETKPASKTELTKVETVKFKARPKTLPLPGLPYQADVAWDYTRQTDVKAYTYSVKETRSNAHVLVRQHIWARPATYSAGSVVCIRGALETLNISDPDAFHVTVKLAAKNQSSRTAVRLLSPKDVYEWPFLGAGLAQGAADSKATFPIQVNNITFKASKSGKFRDKWPSDDPDGLVGLEFDKDGVVIELPKGLKAERADLQVIQLDTNALTLTAYDAKNKVLDSLTTPARSGVQHLLKVHGPGIAYVQLKGGGGKAILRWVSFALSDERLVKPLYSATKILTYEGQLTLDSKEKADKWRGMLSAQTVSLLSASTTPVKAAASISGAETAILATTKAPCTICLNLDDLFVVK